MPSDRVVTGDWFWRHQLNQMRNGDLLSTDAKLLYFYSDALIDLKRDGNGLSDREVFSYWRDDNGIEHREKATFAEIADIQIKEGESWDANTEITIQRHDGDPFVLLASSTQRGDKKFTNTLLKLWRSHNAEPAL